MRPVLRLSPVEFADSAPTTPSAMDVDDVFAMDEEGSLNGKRVPWEQSAAAALDSLRSLEALLSPSSEPAMMLARHVELAAGGAHRVDCEALCSVLQRLGYSAKLHDSSAALHKFRQGVRHQFISVCLPDGSAAGLASFIVEPNFRDAFCVAHPTPRYAALLDGLPAAVVTTQAALARAVGLLAREMARSFADQGQDLPPWRSAQALLAKWQLGGPAATHAYSYYAAGGGGAGCSAWAAGDGGYGAPAADLLAKQHAAFGAA